MKQSETLMLFDFSVAFDTVNQHSLLLNCWETLSCPKMASDGLARDGNTSGLYREPHQLCTIFISKRRGSRNNNDNNPGAQ